MAYVVVVYVVPIPVLSYLPLSGSVLWNYAGQSCISPDVFCPPSAVTEGSSERALTLEGETSCQIEPKLSVQPSLLGSRTSCGLSGSVPFNQDVTRNCGIIGEKWFCQDCDRYFATIRSFANHVVDKHAHIHCWIGEKLAYTCPFCNNFNGFKSQFYHHFLFCNSDRNYANKY